MESYLRTLKILDDKEMQLWRQHALGAIQKNRNIFPISFNLQIPFGYDTSKRMSGKEFDNWIIKQGYSVGYVEGNYIVITVPSLVADHAIIFMSFSMKTKEVKNETL